MRAPTEFIKILTGRVLNMGALNSVNEGFPIGEAWRRLILRIAYTETHGSGSGTIADAVYNCIKAITLKTSRGWVLYNNVPGRAFYVLDKMKLMTDPVYTVFAGASGTFYVYINLWFVDPMLARPEDTLLDTSLFNKIQLDILMGGVVDFMTTIGTDTLTATFDLYLERIRGLLPAKVKPKEYVEISCPAPVNPASATEINLERADNKAYKRLIINACNAAIAGTPFSGTLSNNTILQAGVDTDKGELINKIPWLVLVSEFKTQYEMETALVGWAGFDFTRDRSKMSALLSGVFSRLRIFWDNDTLSTSQVSAIVEALKQIA